MAVSITDDATAADAEAAKKAAIKDRPVWMTESTIGDVTINDTVSTLRTLICNILQLLLGY